LVSNKPANETFFTTSGTCNSNINYTQPSFTDNCDGIKNGTIISGLSPGSSFPIGDTYVKYSYTDISGNGPIYAEFTLTVEDNELPTFSNTNDQNLNINNNNCTFLVSDNSLDVNASDNCSILSLTHNYDGGGTSLSGKTFPLGNSIVTWTATDANNNTNEIHINISISTNLNVSYSSPIDNIACSNETINFIANSTGGYPPYSYVFEINNSPTTIGVTGNTLSSEVINNEDDVKVILIDSFGCRKEVSKTMNIIKQPQPIFIYE